MLINNKNRLELESKVLAAAFKQSLEQGDLESADLAHKELFRLIRERHLALAMSVNETVLSVNTLEPAKPPQDCSFTQLPSSSEKDHQDNSSKAKPTEGNFAHVPVIKNDSINDDLAQTNSAPINVYELLSLPRTCSYKLIHKKFLQLVRKLLITNTKGAGIYHRHTLEMLGNLWIAHDILADENIRATYDAHLFGLNAGSHANSLNLKEPPPISEVKDGPSLRLGELLRAAGFIDDKELEIACDMHKAMREMPFGRFLVRQDFIEEKKLEAVLLGQRFLRERLINLEQFQEAMNTFSSSSKNLAEILLESGHISQSDLCKVQNLSPPEHQQLLLGESALESTATNAQESD